MKCQNCNSFDSMLQFMYVDKNNNLVTEGELTTFGVLHPEENGKFYSKILLCGICYEQLGQQNNRIIIGKSTHRSSLGKSPTTGKSQNYYICPYCKTANEPLRNTCKKCERILFSTEYETKEVFAGNTRGINNSFNKKILLIPLVMILAIACIAIKGTYNRVPGIQTNQVIQDHFITGQSTYEWPDGTKYTGEFKDGQPHGQGKMSYVNGSIYSGNWVNGKPQ